MGGGKAELLWSCCRAGDIAEVVRVIYYVFLLF